VELRSQPQQPRCNRDPRRAGEEHPGQRAPGGVEADGIRPERHVSSPIKHRKHRKHQETFSPGTAQGVCWKQGKKDPQILLLPRNPIARSSTGFLDLRTKLLNKILEFVEVL
jgi:hypothetical protein